MHGGGGGGGGHSGGGGHHGGGGGHHGGLGGHHHHNGDGGFIGSGPYNGSGRKRSRSSRTMLVLMLILGGIMVLSMLAHSGGR